MKRYLIIVHFALGTTASKVRETLTEAYRTKQEEARRQASEEDEGTIRHDGVQEER